MQVFRQMLYRSTLVVVERLSSVDGDVVDRPRNGRPRVTTAADDRYIVLQYLRNSRLTAAATGRQYSIHPQTVIYRLRQNVQSIRVYRPYFGQIVTLRHRTARRDWCRRHLHFRRTDRNLILFSDEWRFNLSHADGPERVYRRRTERFVDACVIELDRFGGGSFLVWGGIMVDNKTHLIVINKH